MLTCVQYLTYRIFKWLVPDTIVRIHSSQIFHWKTREVIVYQYMYCNEKQEKCLLVNTCITLSLQVQIYMIVQFNQLYIPVFYMYNTYTVYMTQDTRTFHYFTTLPPVMHGYSTCTDCHNNVLRYLFSALEKEWRRLYDTTSPSAHRHYQSISQELPPLHQHCLLHYQHRYSPAGWQGHLAECPEAD